MSWGPGELEAIDAVDELRIASYRADGSLRPYVIIWMVAVDGDLYVRTWGNPPPGWFRRAKASGRGRIQAGGVERDITVAGADPRVRERIDDAYASKYERYGAGNLRAMTGPDKQDLTLRLDPVD